LSRKTITDAAWRVLIALDPKATEGTTIKEIDAATILDRE
jgi:hypothetical protein